MSRRAGSARLTLIGGAILLAACVEIPTGANDILSFSFDPLPFPSVVVGDSLRDSLGIVKGLSLKAYNYSGEEVADPEVTFTAVDRGLRVDSNTGIVVGDSVRSGARIVAMVRELTATATLAVTLRPDTVIGSNDRDSLSYSLVDTASNVSPTIGVRVLSQSAVRADSSVASYLVSFLVVSHADTAFARLVNESGTRSSLDTTDSRGVAGRRVKVDVARLTALTDSVIIHAFVKHRGVNIRGSPARLVLKLKPRT